MTSAEFRAERKRAQMRLLNASRHNAALLPDAQRDYATAKLADVIQAELAKAPPLTAGQVTRLQAIISASGSSAALA